MGIINITSDRKNVTLDSDMILYSTFPPVNLA